MKSTRVFLNISELAAHAKAPRSRTVQVLAARHVEPAGLLNGRFPIYDPATVQIIRHHLNNQHPVIA